MAKEIHRIVREKNRTLNQWEQYYRKTWLQSFPPTIQFPTGTRCNLKCRFCSDRKSEEASSAYEDLTFEKFRSTIIQDGWRAGLTTATKIVLYGWGEPLFNPDYERIFDYIVGNYPGLGVTLSTNGILFNPTWSEKITAIDNAEVNFSVNAATQDTYRKLTGADQFPRIIDHIRYLSELRAKSSKKNPYISLSFVATTENIQEMPDFVVLAADLKADCVIAQDIMTVSPESDKLSLTNDPMLAYQMCEKAREKAREGKLRMEFLSFETHHENYFPGTAELAEDRNFCIPPGLSPSSEVPSPYFSVTDCFDPWERFMICANGDVFPCCQFQNLPGSSLGNIYGQSFQDIWNGDAYQTLRATINTPNLPSSCAICPRKAGLS